MGVVSLCDVLLAWDLSTNISGTDASLHTAEQLFPRLHEMRVRKKVVLLIVFCFGGCPTHNHKGHQSHLQRRVHRGHAQQDHLALVRGEFNGLLDQRHDARGVDRDGGAALFRDVAHGFLEPVADDRGVDDVRRAQLLGEAQPLFHAVDADDGAASAVFGGLDSDSRKLKEEFVTPEGIIFVFGAYHYCRQSDSSEANDGDFVYRTSGAEFGHCTCSRLE